MKCRIALSVMLFALLAFINGCDSSYDNPIETQKVINVSGRVKGGALNTGLPYAKIRIEDKETYTDEFGHFNISGVKTPYTVYITDTVANSGCIYDGLSEPECILKFFSRQGIYNTLSSQINYTYSGSATSNAKKIFFTDGKNISGVGAINFPTCSVYLPNNNPVTGRAYLLLYTQGLSYDRFGFIDNVTLSPNSSINLVFNDSICGFFPSSARVTGTINIANPQLLNNFTLCTIYFSPRMFSTFALDLILEPISGNSFDILIPSNLGVEFYPMMWVNYYDYSTGASNQCYYYLPKAGGTGLVLNVPTTPQIVSPGEYSIINENTLFTFSDASSQDIFELTFTDSVKTVMYYTGANTVSLSNMSKLGLGSFTPASDIKFTVTAIGQFNSLNDFANPNINNLNQRISFPVSRKYFFNP